MLELWSVEFWSCGVLGFVFMNMCGLGVWSFGVLKGCIVAIVVIEGSGVLEVWGFGLLTFWSFVVERF